MIVATVFVVVICFALGKSRRARNSVRFLRKVLPHSDWPTRISSDNLVISVYRERNFVLFTEKI